MTGGKAVYRSRSQSIGVRPIKSHCIYSEHLSRETCQPSFVQLSLTLPQHTSCPSALTLLSQMHPVVSCAGFSATRRTRRSSTCRALQSGRAHTSSYLSTLSPGNNVISSLLAKVPASHTRLVSR